LLPRIALCLEAIKNQKRKISEDYRLENHPKLFEDFFAFPFSKSILKLKLSESLVDGNDPFIVAFMGSSVLCCVLIP